MEELDFYKAVCNIQDQYIKGFISNNEFEQRLEIERRKWINSLKEKTLSLDLKRIQQEQFEILMRGVNQMNGGAI